MRRADQLQLVDLTPEALRARLAHGDIYPAERIDAALGNYFRPGNLGALRELALLWIADRVDEGLAEYRAPARHRAAVGDARARGRRAHRLAPTASGSSAAPRGWPSARTAIWSPCTSSRRTGSLRRSPTLLDAAARRSSSELGGTYREVVGADVGEALVDAARALNATQIVLGATRRSRWRELTQGSVINRVIRELRRRTRRPRDQPTRTDDRTEPRGPRKRRPSGAAPRGVSLGWLLARRRPAAARPVVLAQPARRTSACRACCCCTSCSSSASRRSAASGRRSPPRSRASCSSTGTSRRRSTRSRSREGENLLALAVFLAVAGARERVRRRSRRAARPRARGPAPRPRRSRGSPARHRSTALLESLRRAFGLEAAARPATGTATAGRLEARQRTGARRPERRRRRRSSSTPTHVLVLDGPRRRPRTTGAILDAFAPSSPRRSQLDELEAEASSRQRSRRANELRDGAPLRRVARPAHAARGDQGVGDSLLAATTSTGPRPTPRSSSPRSTRRPTASTRSSAICST